MQVPEHWLLSESSVRLLPVDFTQQFLDAVFRAVYADLKVLYIRGVGRMYKKVPIDVIGLFPPAGPPVAEE